MFFAPPRITLMTPIQNTATDLPTGRQITRINTDKYIFLQQFAYALLNNDETHVCHGSYYQPANDL